jgi:predicted nucleic acid-binding protein
MKHVLDSCVGFKWCFVEIDADKAHKLRDDYHNAVIDLLAPDVFPIEFAHAVTRAERANRVTPDQGLKAIGAMMTMLPVLHPSLTLLARAYELSSQFRIGVYDCLYVALAEQEQCDLVTADQRLITNLGSQFPIISLDSL